MNNQLLLDISNWLLANGLAVLLLITILVLVYLVAIWKRPIINDEKEVKRWIDQGQG